MKAKTTRRALLMSVISLLLCVSMLTGTTFAWFTDSVASANNMIKSGNLDVELYYQAEGQTGWTQVTGSTNVFLDGALWEPGHTEVVKLKIVNEGSLALKYQLGVNIVSETDSIDAQGNAFWLSDYIKFGIVEGDQDYSREQAVAAVDDTATALKNTYHSKTIKLLPKADSSTAEDVYTDTVTMVVYMPTDVGNEANHGAGRDVPTINLGINLFANQVDHEADSFGSDYDGDTNQDAVPSIGDLEQKYDFKYFPSLSDAFGISAKSDWEKGKNAKDDTTPTGAYYDENGKLCVVLLEDTVAATRLSPTADMTLNLGGHKLSSDNILCINVTGGNFVIDGRLPGSGINHTGTAGTIGCVQVPASGNAESLTILGGTYTVNNTANGQSVGLNLKNKNCVTTVSDCTILASTADSKANGIVNAGTAVISNCDIRGYSNVRESNGQHTALGFGIYNTGTLTVKNSDLFGTQAGIGSLGPLTVDGGTYAGYTNGGIYLNGNGTTSRIRNASVKDAQTLPEGYESTGTHTGVGIFIAGNNNTAYMDNCDIFGSEKPIALRGTTGEPNGTLYISNSRINTDKEIRIDNDTHKLYIGAGNNFTADHTDRPSVVIQTNEVYK